MAVGDIYKLHLESIAPGGNALGRFEGKPVFVEGGAINETVTCRVTQEHNTWAFAEILEIIKPSPARIQSDCAFYNTCAGNSAARCGGCNLAHINYEAQLAAKENILRDSFFRIGGMEPPFIKVFSSPPLEYRNRMQFHCLRNESKKHNDRKFGLKGKQSEEIIAVTDCPVAVSGIRNIIKTGSLQAPPEKDRFTVFCKDDVLLNEGGQSRGKINLLEKEIILDAGVFFQSNCFMLEKLILEMEKIAKSADKNSIMADFFCGAGTFAFFLSGLFSKVICAEENKTAVSLARENLKGVNAEFFALRDTDWQRAVFQKNNKIDFAVIDPPRAGLNKKFAFVLTQERIPVLAYVSCDPASLARDSKILTNGGYKLKDLMLFDFYPQTSHIESLAVFEK